MAPIVASRLLDELRVPISLRKMLESRRRPPGINDEFLTVEEVAALLKVNQQTIRNWIEAGKLPAVRVGRRVRVIRRDLDQLLDQSRTVPEREPDDQLVVDAQEFWGG